jgi:hypothetical protein
MPTDVRPLIPLADQPPLPSGTKKQFLIPHDPANRGDIDFACPVCKRILVKEMAEHYIASAPSVFCGRCKLWLSPGGSSGV